MCYRDDFIEKNSVLYLMLHHQILFQVCSNYFCGARFNKTYKVKCDINIIVAASNYNSSANGRHCHCSSTYAGNDGTEDQMQRKLIGCNLTVMVLENNEEIEDDYVIVNAH